MHDNYMLLLRCKKSGNTGFRIRTLAISQFGAVANESQRIYYFFLLDEMSLMKFGETGR